MTDVAVVDQTNPSNAGTPQVDTAALAQAVAEQLKQPITFANILAKQEPVAPVIKQADDAPGADAIKPVVYEKTGELGLDMALEFIGNLGYDEKHPAVAAAFNGDFTPIKAVLAINDKAKGWENFVALAERSFADGKAKQEAAAKERSDAVLAAVGGQEAWSTLLAFAKQEATPEEVAALNKMLAAGPFEAAAAARQIAEAYSRKVGTVVKPASAVRPGASRSDAPTTPEAPKTRRELVKAVEALRRTHGSNFQSTPEYARLHAQFAAR